MKRYLGILLALVLVLTLGACAAKKTVDEDTPPVDDPIDDNEDIDDEIVDPIPEDESKEVILYFANKKYIESGDEDLEKMFSEKRVVEYGEIPLEEGIVRELMKGPEDTDNLSTVIPSTVELIDVDLSEGTAFVNFAQEGMSGSSLQESFTINQIISSLIELDTVERVQFLIDGEVAESLMGHISIDEPFEGIDE